MLALPTAESLRPSGRVTEPGIRSLNSPFYSYVLGCQAFKHIEAKGYLVLIQTLLLFKCILLCYRANWILVSIATWSTSASLQIKDLATNYTTVKWPIPQELRFYLSHARDKTKNIFTCLKNIFQNRATHSVKNKRDSSFLKTSPKTCCAEIFWMDS